MRILVLNYEYPPLGGGAAPVCEQLCRLFARHGHGVDVVTMHYRGLPRVEERDGVRLERVPAIRKHAATCETPEMLSYVLSAWPRVAWRLLRGRYDVIHLHFIIPTGLLAWLATRTARVPYAITAHGSDVPGYNPDRFQSEHRITTPLLKMILRKASLITAPSKYLRGLLIDACGPFEVMHIPNGIEVDRFTPRPKQKRILMTGRLLPRKGFQHVLTALEGIADGWEIHIAGDGPLRAEMEAQAKRLGLPVTFHGWIANDSDLLRELYETSAIFCLPSERENASISLLEAMLAGMAVITSNVSGCPETVGDTGVVVPPADPAALRGALAPLLADEALRTQMGGAARARVLDTFDWEVIGQQYLAELERLAQTRSQSSVS